MAFGFITNIKNGFMAANEVRKIVLRDRQLFLYPVLAVIFGIVAIVILGGISLFVLLAVKAILPMLIVLFVLYLLVSFIAVYFLVAMLISFREFANNNNITVMEALNRTNQYKVLILKWVLFIAVVKIFLDFIEMALSMALSKFGMVGNIIANLITGVASLALTVAALFAVPIIIDNRTGPFATIKTSTEFIIKNWGETLGGFAYTELFQIVLCGIGGFLFFLAALSLVSAGNVSALISSIGWVGFLAFGFLGLVLIFAGAMTIIGSLIIFIIILVIDLQTPSAGIATFLAGLGLLFVMVGHLLNYMMFNCFKLIIYDYKNSNRLPADFDKTVIDNSVQMKKGTGGGQRGGANGIGGGLFGGGGLIGGM